MTQISSNFSLNFQKIFWPLTADHGGPSGDTNLSANLTDTNFEKLATMISRIFLFIKISIFSQTKYTKQTIVPCWIITNIKMFTYFINNVTVYYFSMIIRNFILF